MEFLDGEKLSVDTSNGVVLEKELTEDEKKGVKLGDMLLVKLRQSRAMAQGTMVSYHGLGSNQISHYTLVAHKFVSAIFCRSRALIKSCARDCTSELHTLAYKRTGLLDRPEKAWSQDGGNMRVFAHEVTC